MRHIEAETRTGATASVTGRKLLFLTCLIGALVAVFSFAGSAAAMHEVASATPSITSDQPDYNPGATVTLTGANWSANDVVHVVVNDDKSQPWSYTTDVSADNAGNFSLQFQLPASFAATYFVQTTGASGASASTTFTDGNVNIKATGVGSAPVAWARFSNTTCASGP